MNTSVTGSRSMGCSQGPRYLHQHRHCIQRKADDAVMGSRTGTNSKQLSAALRWRTQAPRCSRRENSKNTCDCETRHILPPTGSDDPYAESTRCTCCSDARAVAFLCRICGTIKCEPCCKKTLTTAAAARVHASGSDAASPAATL
jgi:hypothetical protein